MTTRKLPRTLDRMLTIRGATPFTRAVFAVVLDSCETDVGDVVDVDGWAPYAGWVELFEGSVFAAILDALRAQGRDSDALAEHVQQLHERREQYQEQRRFLGPPADWRRLRNDAPLAKVIAIAPFLARKETT